MKQQLLNRLVHPELNKYIFLPYGHLVMKCSERPELIGPPINNWEPIGNGWYWPKQYANCYKNNCKLNSFSFDLNGNVYNFAPLNHFSNCEIIDKPCSKYKNLLIKKGYATQLDANFFAMKVLQNYPQVAKALAYRFLFLMVDEAQDTSEIQMKIIDLLIENGLKEVMLIGDPNQAIYEWRTANPKLFIQKYKEWLTNSMVLNENWRSSQKICDFSSKISLPSESLIAKKEIIKDFNTTPIIIGYQENKYTTIISEFIELCRKEDIDPTNDDVSILVRGNEIIKEIKGVRKSTSKLNPWNDELTKGISENKHSFDQGNLKQGFYNLERLLCKRINNLKFCTSDNLKDIISKLGFTTWRKEIYSLLTKLPPTTGLLKEWVKKADEILKQSTSEPHDLKIKRDKGNNKYSLLTFEEILTPPSTTYLDTNLKIGTVHSVKGETFEAILLILKSKAGNGQNYTNVLNENIAENEELRIVYVGITRPRKILVLAVPEKDKNTWERKFFN